MIKLFREKAVFNLLCLVFATVSCRSAEGPESELESGGARANKAPKVGVPWSKFYLRLVLAVRLI
jgi:hypothetical protein